MKLLNVMCDFFGINFSHLPMARMETELLRHLAVCVRWTNTNCAIDVLRDLQRKQEVRRPRRVHWRGPPYAMRECGPSRTVR